MEKLCFYAILVIGLSLGSANATADTAMLMKQCNGCHGDNGVSRWEDVPTIAGLAEFVHADALLAYKDRARPCATSAYRQGDTSRSATDMCSMAEKLSEESIESLAKSYAVLPYVAAKQPFDAGKAALGKAVHEKHCDRCHSDGGMNPEDEAGMLGGQWTQFLRGSFGEFADGTRDQPKKMKEKIDLLSKTDIDELLHYYASLQ